MRGSVVVIMAKQPAPGRTKTRLSPPLSPSGAADLYEALLNDTITLVSRVRGVRLAVAITPAPAARRPGEPVRAARPQRAAAGRLARCAPRGAWRPDVPPGASVLPVEGSEIGVCLDHVTATLFERGYSRVIALNSDGPTLPVAYIEQADALLERSDVVLGPSEDGGYYLVGLRGAQPGLFRDIAWSTPRVMAQTLERADALGLSVERLPPWYDIDTGADLDRLRVELSSLPPDALACTRRFLAAADVPESPVRPPEEIAP